MRRIMVLGLVMLVAAVAYAARPSDKKASNGFVVDNMCAGKSEKETDKIKSHPVSCALSKGCADSGFAILAADDNKLYKLDENSNKKVAKLLKSANSGQKGLEVKFEGTVEGDTLKLEKIAAVEAGK